MSEPDVSVYQQKLEAGDTHGALVELDAMFTKIMEGVNEKRGYTDVQIQQLLSILGAEVHLLVVRERLRIFG